MKDFLIFTIGTIILSPVVILGLSGNFFGFLIALVYLLAVIYSERFFPKFWRRWMKINLDYVNLLEGKK
jgi:hypothetical protein